MHTFLVRHVPRHCTIEIHLFHMHKSPASKLKHTKWKTTIEEVEDKESTPSGHFQPHQEQKKPEPFSSLWILLRLRDLAAEAGIGTLKQWVHDQKQRATTIFAKSSLLPPAARNCSTGSVTHIAPGGTLPT